MTVSPRSSTGKQVEYFVLSTCIQARTFRIYLVNVRLLREYKFVLFSILGQARARATCKVGVKL